jgi:hypothetical protein
MSAVSNSVTPASTAAWTTALGLVAVDPPAEGVAAETDAADEKSGLAEGDDDRAQALAHLGGDRSLRPPAAGRWDRRGRARVAGPDVAATSHPCALVISHMR